MTVFPTSYFPTIAYLKALCKEPDPVLDLGEHYVKQTYRNRCTVLSSNGKQDLSIPVIRPNGNRTATKEAIVSDELGWRRDHFRCLKAGYSSSPYFDHYASEIEDLIFQKTSLLIDFNANCLSFISRALQLEVHPNKSLEYLEEVDNDYRTFNFENSEIPYQQVLFSSSHFTPSLSVLDALFCIGPMTRKLILI